MIRYLLLLACAVCAPAADQAVTWKRWELLLKDLSSASSVDVTFQGPGGQSIKVPAFRSGDTFRARVAFPQAGAWTWEASPDAGHKAQRGRVSVAAYTGANPL